VNTPALTIAVILDSPAGLHQGGQVCAPIFKRIAEQVLEYLRVPHDLDVKTKQTLVASAKNPDVDESSDHLGAPVQDEQTTASTAQASAGKSPTVNKVTPLADVKASLPVPAAPAPEVAQAQEAPSMSSPESTPTSGTVVLAVDGGAVVPSFLGKPLRSAVEIAQQSGLEINAIGTGIAREQSPAPGSHLLAGQHITVRFAH
jgi:cell division protein FtsI (penicillin-binding protein 3)